MASAGEFSGINQFYAGKGRLPLDMVTGKRPSYLSRRPLKAAIPLSATSRQEIFEPGTEWFVEEFVDSLSGTDNARPEFQRMIALAEDLGRSFNTIVVYSLSRFYRSGPEMELLIRRLWLKGVQVISATQPIGNDTIARLMRQLIGAFDEHPSAENGKNTRRAMRENAEQNFWNGTTAPLGYKVIEVERRGPKIKKRLSVEPIEKELVLKIYDLYLDGPPGQGPLGVKNIVKYLNERGYRTRRGARFGTSAVHKILSSRYYADGEYVWGAVDRRTGKANPPSERGIMHIPPLVSLERFEAVQIRRQSNNRHNTPPRVVNGPSLLISIARCGVCGSSMTRTGTARGGRRYSYYSCSGTHRTGKLHCPGRHVRTDKLDGLVLDALATRLFAPDRLGTVLRSLADKQALRCEDTKNRLVALQSAVEDTRLRLARLYRSIENGIAEEDDILRERIRQLKHEKDIAEAALGNAKRQILPEIVISAERIAHFGSLMRDRLHTADTNARRRYIGSLVRVIEVHDGRIRIVGEKETLARAVTAGEPPENVIGFEPKWRARKDSNL